MTSEIDYKCDICDKVCRTSCNLVRHNNDVHQVEMNGIDYICKRCQLTYKSIRLLKLHLQIVHGNEQSICNRCHNDDDDHIDRKHFDEQQYICSKCGEMFGVNGETANSTTVSNTVQCDMCDRLVGKYRYFRHAQTHLKHQISSKNYKCDNCEQLCANATQLFLHTNSRHQRIQVFDCEMCGRSFSRLSSQRRHCKKMHTTPTE